MFLLLSLLLAASSSADLPKERLLAHVAKRGFSDNRKLKNEPYFTGWKDCCHVDVPRTALDGYWRKGTQEFRQIRLKCELCSKEGKVTQALVDYCRARLGELFTDVFGTSVPEELSAKLTTSLKEEKLNLPVGRTEVKNGFLKCDNVGGRGIYVGIYPVSPVSPKP
jgi:hypothetical protein